MQETDVALDSVSEAADLVDRLRDDIVNARYLAHEPLRFRSLSDAYGASVSTLREALSRLAAECLVEFEPFRGFRVAAISVEDLADILHARAEIEGVALRRSIECGDDDWEAQIVAAHHRLLRVQTRAATGGADAVAEWELRHREFHQSLIAGCRSRWLIRFCDMLRVQSDRYRHLVLVPPGTYPQLVAHHRPIMDAALARKVDDACRLLAEHFEESLRVIEAGIAGGRKTAPARRSGVAKTRPAARGRRTIGD